MDRAVIERILTYQDVFDLFLEELKEHDLLNFTHVSTHYVTEGYWGRGVFVGRYSNRECILVATDPAMKELPICNDLDNPGPFLADGKLFMVWSVFKRKLKDGPWVPAVMDVLQFLLDRIELAKERRAVEEKLAELKKREQQMDDERRVIEAWAAGANPGWAPAVQAEASEEASGNH